MIKIKNMKCPHCQKEIDDKLIASHLGKKGGTKGGESLKKQKGADYYKELGKKSAEKRWGKQKTG
jgi:hypothetical protein